MTQRSAIARSTLSIVAVVVLAYIAVLASWPQVREHLPAALRWFGRPNSALSIAVVIVILVLLCAALWRVGSNRRPGAPLAIVAGLALISTIYGMASYWRCHDDSHPTFFTPLLWTASLVKGGGADRALDAGSCPGQLPVALDIAQLCALAAVFLSVVGVAMALFQSRVDRLRVYFARSVTVVVDMDDDARSMVDAIARTLGHRVTLAVVTDTPDRPCVKGARAIGARIIGVDFNSPQAIGALPVWRKLNRLYLLSPDPSTNLLRLTTITAAMSDASQRQRIPLIVRIDDPWQAGAWRAQHFGGSENRWAADAIGRYEVTARRLLDQLALNQSIERILVCGTSRLTLALCADLAQRQVEWDYYADPASFPPPRITIVADHAEEYRDDHEFACAQMGLAPAGARVDAVSVTPSAASVISLLNESGATSTAVILVDAISGVDLSLGTRLAARFPSTPIYGWDPSAQVTQDQLALVGQLRTYRLSMDLPGGQAQDTWERAARLIHDRYAAEPNGRSTATMPWADLDEFYRGSNRRQVQNALWMVEKIGNHTWNTFGSQPDSLSTASLHGREPLEQLALLGFDRATALKMARAEHEDWCRYYRAAGWKYGPVRDDSQKMHDKLVAWATVEADPRLLDSALTSTAATLSKLRELGYRSTSAQPWKSFRRRGTVDAEQRSAGWTWTTGSGQTMRADPGDWSVRDVAGGDPWSVRDDIFRATYEHVDGRVWRRVGVVAARPAHAGETVDTLEGPVTASAGDWILRGEAGEQWPVPGDDFSRRYEGPISD